MHFLQKRRPYVLQAEIPCVSVHKDGQAHDCTGTGTFAARLMDLCVVSGG